MRELIKMWKYPNMIAMTAFSSAIYVAFLVPFKSVPLIPGFTEIRPASIFPVLFGLFFGPAGAWGSAFGNLAGDLFGTFSAGSLFGFIGNFLNAYLPYKLWGKISKGYVNEFVPNIDSPKSLVQYGTVTVISSAACAIVIAWGCDSMGMVPFAKLVSIIMLNNTSMALVLGPVILPGSYRLIKKLGLLWTDIMVEEKVIRDIPEINPILVITGALGGLAVGIAASLGLSGQSILEIGTMTSGAGHIGVSLSVLPFLVIMLYGASKL